MEEQETITVDDLERIYIRAQDETGRWRSVNCRDATDKQFDAWIKTRIEILGIDEPWSPQERADVCDHLNQQHPLVMLRKDVPPLEPEEGE